jgi:hypothetical protein
LIRFESAAAMTAAIPYNWPSSSAAATTTSSRSSTARTTARGSSPNGAAVHISRLIQSGRGNLQMQLISDPGGGLLKVRNEGVHDGKLTFSFGPPIVGNGPAPGRMTTAACSAAFVLAAGVVRVEHGW